MKLTKFAMAAVLAAFSSLTAYVVVVYGFSGFYREVFQNPATALCIADLAISLLLIIAWMVKDAKKEGRNAITFVLITLAIGAAGPLLYLLTRRKGLAID